MPRITLHPWPNGHVTAVVIRDDDASYFTPPHMVEKIYAEAWKTGFKASLGVIPNVRAIDDFFVPPRHRGTLSQHKVNENEELLEFLRGKLDSGSIDIAQHGYTHESFNGVPEFCISNSREIRSRLETGRGILEACLPAKISAFIPPWNKVSGQAKKILGEHYLTLCLGAKKRYFGRFGTAGSLTKFNDSRPFELYSSFDAWSNRDRAFIFTRERLQKAKGEFEKSLRRGSAFCLLNHYWGYYEDWGENISEGKLNSFYSLLDFINGHDVWKTTVSDIGRWLKAFAEIRFQVKGKKIVLISPGAMRGVTIKAEGCSLAPEKTTGTAVRQRGDTTFLIFKELEAGKHEFVFTD